MEALVRERDEARSAMVWLDSKLAVEQEAKRTMEVGAKVSWQKVAEVEEARQTAKGIIMELRSSLGLLETTRDATCSELHEAQELVVGASSSLPSFPRLRGGFFHSEPPRSRFSFLRATQG